MSEWISAFKNVRTLKKELKDFNSDELISMREKLDAVIESTLEQEAAYQEENRERLEKIELIKEMMQEAGLSAEDLATLQVKSKKTRAPRPAKYRFPDDKANDGFSEWTGQGRTPKALQSQLDEGKQLDDFLINQES